MNETIAMATKGTWTIFKANASSSSGWRERQLNGMLNNIIREAHHSRSDNRYLPKVGDRVEEFDQGQHRPSNWVVASVEQFSSPDSEEKIVVCRCDYVPVNAEWQPCKRGKPLSEMLKLAAQNEIIQTWFKETEGLTIVQATSNTEGLIVSKSHVVAIASHCKWARAEDLSELLYVKQGLMHPVGLEIGWGDAIAACRHGNMEESSIFFFNAYRFKCASKEQCHHSIKWSEEDQEYVGLCAELPGLSYLSKSYVLALEGICGLAEDYLKEMQLLKDIARNDSKTT